MIECPTCHAPLLNSNELKQHIWKNPACKWIKTRNPKEIEGEVKKEVKRQKERMAYRRNLENNRKIGRDRKKKAFDINPQKDRDRMKRAYKADPQKERDRKREEFEANKGHRGTVGDLQKFLDEGRYGPIFRAVHKVCLNH